jgi:hypothetical protein
MTGRWQAIAAVIASAALLAGCGGNKSAAPAATTAVTTTTTGAAASGKCSSYGRTWVRDYNKTAIAQGNPIRMLSACCGPTLKAGVHHCYLRVTLAGTKNLGCETVDLGPDGTPVGIGKHENCALHE